MGGLHISWQTIWRKLANHYSLPPPPAQKYMHFPRQLNLDKLHRDSLTAMTAAASDLVMFLQSGFDVYRYYSKCQAVQHNKMQCIFLWQKARHQPNYGQRLFMFVWVASNQSQCIYTEYTPWYLPDYFLSTIIMFEHVFGISVGLSNLFHCFFTQLPALALLSILIF